MSVVNHSRAEPPDSTQDILYQSRTHETGAELVAPCLWIRVSVFARNRMFFRPGRIVLYLPEPDK